MCIATISYAFTQYYYCILRVTTFMAIAIMVITAALRTAQTVLDDKS